ncbi:MAG: hypothetical protein GX568_05230 [Candidatus Gastranaerophilales bacterium]|nr:hypothetical protein [Candidatus Gastranaerophilales bacterium]
MTWIPPENNIITAEQTLTKAAKKISPYAKTVTLKDQETGALWINNCFVGKSPADEEHIYKDLSNGNIALPSIDGSQRIFLKTGFKHRLNEMDVRQEGLNILTSLNRLKRPN